MSCHFGRGVVVGGLLGVLAAMKWRRIIESCPAYQMVEGMVFDEMADNKQGCYRPYRRHGCRSDRDL